jgi:hypothetical protein
MQFTPKLGRKRGIRQGHAGARLPSVQHFDPKNLTIPNDQLRRILVVELRLSMRRQAQCIDMYLMGRHSFGE